MKKKPRDNLSSGEKKDVFLAFLIDSERTRDLDGFTFVGLNPCNSKSTASLEDEEHSDFLALVLRGLDILTSKETIEAKLIELTFVYMKNCAIVKDNYTGVSRGFAFVEYNSIHVSEDRETERDVRCISLPRIRSWSMRNCKQQRQEWKSMAKLSLLISRRTILLLRKEELSRRFVSKYSTL